MAAIQEVSRRRRDVALKAALSEVRYACEVTSFTRRWLERVGLQPASITTLDGFRLIPVTSKADYRENFPVGVVSSRLPLDAPGLFHTQSSGTAGDRQASLEFRAVLTARMLRTAAVHPSLESLLHTSPRVLQLAAPACKDGCGRPGTTSATSAALVPNLPVDILTTSPERWMDVATDIELFQPQLYYVDPVHFSELALFLEASHYRPPPATVVMTFSSVTHTARDTIARTFGGSELVEVYSMSEVGWIAAECSSGRLHLNVDNYFVEILVHDRDARTGEIGEVVVTTTDHGATPRLRYRTGDLMAVLGPCDCGNPSPTVQFEGRAVDCVTTPKGKRVTPRMVDDAVGSRTWLRRYRLNQARDGRLTFDFCPATGRSPEEVGDVLDALHTLCAPRTSIAARKRSYLPSDQSGKFRSCTSALTRESLDAGARR